MLLSIFMRPQARLPKLIALGCLMELIAPEIWDDCEVRIKATEEKFHQSDVVGSDDGSQDVIYNLDCCGNGYRTRGFETELDVILNDFKSLIPEGVRFPEIEKVLDMVRRHNVRTATIPTLEVKMESSSGKTVKINAPEVSRDRFTFEVSLRQLFACEEYSIVFQQRGKLFAAMNASVDEDKNVKFQAAGSERNPNVQVERFFVRTTETDEETILKVTVVGSGFTGPMKSFRNMLNKPWGSIGFISGSAWELIGKVKSGYQEEPMFDAATDELTLNDTGEIQWKSAKRKQLTPDDFIEMSIEVVRAFFKAERERRMTKARGDVKSSVTDWNKVSQLKGIRALLDTPFQGKTVRSGNFAPFTLSRYIQDLCVLGLSVSKVQKKLRPWLSLWRNIERTLKQAEGIEPDQIFSFDNGSADGVIFQQNGSDNNPLVHRAALKRVPLVIVKSESGHCAIFARDCSEKSLTSLARALQSIEPMCWAFEGGAAIYNGSKSRLEVPVSNIPVSLSEGEAGHSLVKLCQKFLRLKTI